MSALIFPRLLSTRCFFFHSTLQIELSRWQIRSGGLGEAPVRELVGGFGLCLFQG
jgi:hypothetical protein